MKRDMDLIRDILLRFEASEHEFNSGKLLDGLEPKSALAGHLRLLEDNEFIVPSISRLFPNGAVYHNGWRISSSGYDFLDSVRDPEIWRRTKASAKDLGSWTVKILADIASSYLRAKAKELGVPI